MFAIFFVVLSCVCRGTEMGGSPTQGVLSKCLKEVRVSEFSSESEHAKGPKP